MKWFLPADTEPDAGEALALIGAISVRTTILGTLEVLNKLSRHSSWSRTRLADAHDTLADICGAPLEITDEDARRALLLAAGHGLTTYDASYVAVARRLGLRLISADSGLLGPGLAVSLHDVPVD